MHITVADIVHMAQSRAEQIRQLPWGIREGRLRRVSGLVLEVEGLPLSIGMRAHVQGGGGKSWLEAECIGFENQTTYLMALDHVGGLAPGALVYPLLTPDLTTEGYRQREGIRSIAIGPQLLGRVVDGLGRPLDGLAVGQVASLGPTQQHTNPLQRMPVSEVLDTGVRAMNGMLTIGRGQRIGLFAGSGVGKSVLLSMLAKNCAADVMVIALVGERSREVREFCEEHLTPQARARAVVVAAPADTSPLARAKGAEYATEVAAWFRDRGQHVVLIVDSLTRFAMAQREIGLSLGEAPVARGYPASVFARIPELVEKVGNGVNPQGSLTAFYTVLLEGDDIHDPVADAARGVFDGHVFLSRDWADAGHYPAIDIQKSISRVMPKLVSKEHLMAARRLKTWIAKHERSRDMVAMGAYMPGSDPELDMALKNWPAVLRYLRQDAEQVAPFGDSVAQLMALARGA